MKRVAALYDRLLQGFIVAVGFVIVIATLLVSIDVVARYFFNRPMAWIFESTEYFMLLVPFLGMAALIKPDGHVRIDLLTNALPPRPKGALDLLSSILCTIACATVAYHAYLSTVSHFKRNVLTYGIYPIPKGYLIAVICLGFVLATIEFARRAIRRMSDLSGDPAAPKDSAEPGTAL